MTSLRFFNRCYWPDSEATGQLLTELCEYLAQRWDVSAVVGQPNWETDREAFVRSGVQERNGVSVHRLLHTQLPKNKRFSRVRNLISFTLATRSWGYRQTRPGYAISDDGPEALRASNETVICETDPFLLPLVVGPMARRRKSRLVYYLQDIYPDVAVAVGVTKNNLLIRMLRNRLKREYNQADAIVVLDEDMKERLVGWGVAADLMHVVPNWMDCSAVKPIKSNNPFREEHGIDEHFIVMHSGNMGMTQRLDVLVDAMKILAETCESKANENQPVGRSAKLMLVGNGAKRQALETQAGGATNVRFLDYQPRESLSASLSAADLHVVSMDQAITGCLAPSKLYGILASGTPVLAIAPKDNAVWRLVQKEKLGWNVQPGDRKAIANAICEAKQMHPNELREIGLRCRALAERLYDKQICCEAFEKVLNRVGRRMRP